MTTAIRVAICICSLVISFGVTSAQIDLQTETISFRLNKPPYKEDSEFGVVADYLYATKKNEFCASFDQLDLLEPYNPVPAKYHKAPGDICLFADPLSGEYILFTTREFSGAAPTSYDLIVLHDGEVVAVLPNGFAISKLDEGEYELLLTIGYRSGTFDVALPMASVAFSVNRRYGKGQEPEHLDISILAPHELLDETNSKEDTIADYLYQRRKAEFCDLFDLYRLQRSSSSLKAPAAICLFHDPDIAGYILFTTGVTGPFHEFILMHNDKVIGLLGWRESVRLSRPGNYKVIVTLNPSFGMFVHTPLRSVEFVISENEM